MPVQDQEVRALFAGLEAKGWSWEDDVLMAPHQSIWFTREEPWMGDLEDFRQRMQARLKRIEGNRDNYEVEADYQGVWDDTAGLVEVLDDMALRPG